MRTATRAQGRNAKTDWKALSKRIGHADVDAGREVANTFADLIIGGLLVTEVKGQGDEPA